MYVIGLDRRMMCHRLELEDSAVTTRGLCATHIEVIFLMVAKFVYKVLCCSSSMFNIRTQYQKRPFEI